MNFPDLAQNLAFSPMPPPTNQLAMPLLTSRNYRCQCGHPVYFRNSACLTCGAALGYDCDQNLVLPLMPALADTVLAANLPLLSPDAVQPLLWQVWRLLSSGTAQGGVRYQDPTQAPPLLQLQDLPGQQSPPPLQAPPLDPNAPPMTDPPAAPPAPAPTASQMQSQSMGTPSASLPTPRLYKRCINLATPAACNWLVAANDAHDFCRACRLNHTIPDLMDASYPDNGYLWGLVESAKRRLVSSLIAMHLPVASRVSEDPERGLMFDLLRGSSSKEHVMTGHDTGLITLNVDEADDARREQVRKNMHEPCRTLLGHFRHEVGHYYWNLLVEGTPWMDGFHELFGDEALDYAEALKRNYAEGPPPDWRQHFVSAYASMHPWEDWAECWAHYMLMRDAVDTARGFGLMSSLDIGGADLEFTPFTLDTLWRPNDVGAADFLAFLNHWSRLTMLLNQMSRSMGQADFYPFTVPPPVLAKLHFIHKLVSSRDWERGSAQGQPVPAMTG